MEGIIKKITPNGYGFIGIEGEEKEVFFHSNNLVGASFEELKEGDKVTFEVEQTPKGPSAVNVEKV